MIAQCVDIRYNRIIDVDDVKVEASSVISIDASTTNTGLSIVDMNFSIPLYSISIRKQEETNVQYKVQLKKIIQSVLMKNSKIEYAANEQLFIGTNINSGIVLAMLKTSIEEIVAESNNELEYIKYQEIPNKTWKKRFFAPDKCPNNSQAEKEMARKKLESIYPIFSKLSQDEVDATCMGIIFAQATKQGINLKPKGAVRPFKYNIDFLVGETFDDALMGINSIDINPLIIENGIFCVKLAKNSNLDKKIYETMGSEDGLVIVEFSPKTAGNLVLQYNLYTVNDDDRIYAFVWRKNRKKS